ncbi:MAG: hypothetical protein K8I01_00010 [Candidatus Methylomirabilis sp.]|nr:hypothetical protein [Deltaproteobacteria bacterium]
MNYPSGEPIRLGDRVWWDGGLAVGYIAEVLTSISDATSAGLSEPGVIISTTRDARGGTPRVAYSQRLLADDGVGLVSDRESREIDAVVMAVVKHGGIGGGGRLGVFREWCGGRLTRWLVVDYGADNRIVFYVTPSLQHIAIGEADAIKRIYL